MREHHFRHLGMCCGVIDFHLLCTFFCFFPLCPLLLLWLRAAPNSLSSFTLLFTLICWKLESKPGFDKLDYLVLPNSVMEISMPTFWKPTVARNLPRREVRWFCTLPQNPLRAKSTSGFHSGLLRGQGLLQLGPQKVPLLWLFRLSFNTSKVFQKLSVSNLDTLLQNIYCYQDSLFSLSLSFFKAHVKVPIISTHWSWDFQWDTQKRSALLVLNTSFA